MCLSWKMPERSLGAKGYWKGVPIQVQVLVSTGEGIQGRDIVEGQQKSQIYLLAKCTLKV